MGTIRTYNTVRTILIGLGFEGECTKNGNYFYIAPTKTPPMTTPKLISLCFLAFLTLSMSAQDADSTKSKKEQKVKDGFSLGGVPVVAYDSDIGFKY